MESTILSLQAKRERLEFYKEEILKEIEELEKKVDNLNYNMESLDDLIATLKTTLEKTTNILDTANYCFAEEDLSETIKDVCDNYIYIDNENYEDFDSVFEDSENENENEDES